MLPVSTANVLLAFFRAMLSASSPMMLCYAAFLDGVSHQRVYLRQAIGNFVIVSVLVEHLPSSHELHSRMRCFPLTSPFHRLSTSTENRIFEEECISFSRAGERSLLFFQRPHRPIFVPFDPAFLQNICMVALLPVSSLLPMPTIPLRMVHFDAMKECSSNGSGGGAPLVEATSPR